MTLTRLCEVATIEMEAPMGPGFFYDHNVRGLTMLHNQPWKNVKQGHRQPLSRAVLVTMHARVSVPADKTWANLPVSTTGGRESEGCCPTKVS